jgi:hypothetical protein
MENCRFTDAFLQITCYVFSCCWEAPIASSRWLLARCPTEPKQRRHRPAVCGFGASVIRAQRRRPPGGPASAAHVALREDRRRAPARCQKPRRDGLPWTSLIPSGNSPCREHRTRRRRGEGAEQDVPLRCIRAAVPLDAERLYMCLSGDPMYFLL